MWTIKLSVEAQKQLKSIDRSASLKIQKYLQERVAKNPESFGKALSADLAGLWRYRIGDYRMICDIKNKELLVLVVKIGHRSKVYDD
jgi:mRNA interferase RelE/StbE